MSTFQERKIHEIQCFGVECHLWKTKAIIKLKAVQFQGEVRHLLKKVPMSEDPARSLEILEDLYYRIKLEGMRMSEKEE